MNLKKISFSPKVLIELPDQELDLIIECAKHHYDGTCRQAAAVGGFLHGMSNFREHPHSLTLRELDLISKIVEACNVLPSEGKAELALKISSEIKAIFEYTQARTPPAIVI